MTLKWIALLKNHKNCPVAGSFNPKPPWVWQSRSEEFAMGDVVLHDGLQPAIHDGEWCHKIPSRVSPSLATVILNPSSFDDLKCISSAKKYNKKYAIILYTKQKDIIFHNKNQFLKVLLQFEFWFFPKTRSSHTSLILSLCQAFYYLVFRRTKNFQVFVAKYPLLRNKMWANVRFCKIIFENSRYFKN